VAPSPLKTLNLIGAGRVGQTLAQLLTRHVVFHIQDVYSRSARSGEAATAFIGGGRMVTDLTQLRPADISLLTVPDSQIAVIAGQLAARPSTPRGAGASPSGPPAATDRATPAVVHCSGFLSAAAALGPLSALGWHVASLHPILSFASPASAVAQFPGTACGIEGDATLTHVLFDAVMRIGGRPFAIDSAAKPLYHAAAVFESNFLPALHDVATRLWQAAGVPPDIIETLGRSMLQKQVDNILSLGARQALTGPAARGDHAVVAAQHAAVARWDASAGDAYAALSRLIEAIRPVDPRHQDKH
jgi:predicted short-subunit dehydrogenase-like oxidoreductase (DUF2520 family)